MSRLGLCLTLAVGLSVGLLFAIDPSLDLAIARFFHALRTSGALDWADGALFVIREFNLYLVVLLIVVCVFALIVQVRASRTTLLPPVRACAFILLVIAVGPGLIVNAVLKEHWARPRPGPVLAATDDTKFRAWWDPSGECSRNCSFASGEASAAFATLAIAVVVPFAWRYSAITLALLYGSLVSATRIAVGGHFVSDVILAGVISALVVWVLHGLIYRWPATRISEEAARAWLESSAIWLQRHASLVPMAIRRKLLARQAHKQIEAPGAARASSPG